MIRFLLLFSLVFTVSNIQSQNISATDLIEKSIKFHDPKGKLLKKSVQMDFTETRPNGSDRKTTILFNLKKEEFSLLSRRDDRSIVQNLYSDIASFYIDGSQEISKEDRKKYRLEKERLRTMRNYYQYLWLLPLKLEDEGTIIDPSVKATDFFGKSSLQVKVTYDPEVGKDIWYFYFDPSNYALIGYRFYHDESVNDGEYILLEGEVLTKGVRLPAKRTWYTHKEDKLLGSDILVELSLSK